MRVKAPEGYTHITRPFHRKQHTHKILGMVHARADTSILFLINEIQFTRFSPETTNTKYLKATSCWGQINVSTLFWEEDRLQQSRREAIQKSTPLSYHHHFLR